MALNSIHDSIGILRANGMLRWRQCLVVLGVLGGVSSVILGHSISSHPCSFSGGQCSQGRDSVALTQLLRVASLWKIFLFPVKMVLSRITSVK